MLIPSELSLSLPRWYSTRALMSIDPVLHDKRTEARALPEYDQGVGRCQSEFFKIQVLLLWLSFRAYYSSETQGDLGRGSLYTTSVEIFCSEEAIHRRCSQWISACFIDISYYFMYLEAMTMPS